MHENKNTINCYRYIFSDRHQYLSAAVSPGRRKLIPARPSRCKAPKTAFNASQIANRCRMQSLSIAGNAA